MVKGVKPANDTALSYEDLCELLRPKLDPEYADQTPVITHPTWVSRFFWNGLVYYGYTEEELNKLGCYKWVR